MPYPTTRNNCTFIGNLGSDPERREFSNGNEYAVADIAVNRYVPDGEDETTWVRLQVTGPSVPAFLKYVRKGTKISVTAQYRTYQYEKNGETQYGHGFSVVSWNIEAQPNGNGSRQRSNESDDLPF